MQRNTQRNNGRRAIFQTLESRTLLAAAPFNFPGFTKESTVPLVFNGFESGHALQNVDAPTRSNGLALTTDNYWQARSIWYDTRVPISKFRTDFSFRSDANSRGADGFTFTILNGPTDTLGANGRGLGSGNIDSPSESIAFNQYNFAKFGSQFGFASNGERPPTNTKMGPIDLHNGHTFKATVTYDGETMKVTVVDASDRSKVFTASQKIDLTSQLASSDAIVGFTAATGANSTNQELLSWSFSGEDATPAPAPVPAPVPAPGKPTLVIPANSSQQPVTGTSAMLDVLGDDATDGEAGLTYTWRVIEMPDGVKAPTYDDNKTNSAKTTNVHFKAAGSYRFRATLTNAAGLTTKSTVDVDVTQSPSGVRLMPHKVKVKVGQRVQFRATMLDQFGARMQTQPSFRYSILSGAGSIGTKNGKFTAPSTEGHVDIGATALGVTGQVGVRVYAGEDAPIVSAGA